MKNRLMSEVVEPVTEAAFKEACRQFVEQIDGSDVLGLCRGGSIWIKAEHALTGSLQPNSFVVLGLATDNRIREEAWRRGVILAVNFDSISDLFNFDVESDDEGDADDPSDSDSTTPAYSTEAGRAELLDCLKSDLGNDYACLTNSMDRHQEIQEAGAEDN